MLKTSIDKYKWLLSRVSLMSPMEIGYRIKKEATKKFEQKSLRDIRGKTALIENKINWYSDIKNKKNTVSFFKNTNMWNEDKACELLEHKFSFFSFKKTFLGNIINWHRDYKNDKIGPLRYCKNIDYRVFEEVGDIKYIWEINRHQHLITLAKAYYLSGNQKYKDEVQKQVLSWIETNPYKNGVNWISSLELGIRLISWSWVWLFLGDIDEDLRSMWLGSIYEHCVFISRNFSRYSSANNHLIGEASGLFIASAVWPFGEESKRWQEMSFDILMDEIERQNYEDGVNKEQAVTYQQFVLDFFILAGLLGEKNGIKFPKFYWQRVEKMMEFIASVMDKGGNIPNIGDSDDGYAVILSENKDFNPYQSILATGAALFQRTDFARKASRFDEKSFWLLGTEGLKRFNVPDKKPFIPVENFEKGGYYILSAFEDTKDEIKVVFDCGPLGYLSIAAHGHSDALSFILNVGGKEFLIDPGTYAYHAHTEWRDYFKGTSAHNTIKVDKEDQSVPGGNFMWLKHAKAKLEKLESTDKYDHIAASHNGYKRLKDPVVHSREIYFDKVGKFFEIKDQIKSKGGHFIEQFFHFSKECSVKNIDNYTWEIKNRSHSIYLEVDKQFNSQLVYGREDPPLGWESKKFDVKHKTNTLVNSCENYGNGEFITIISTAKL